MQQRHFETGAGMGAAFHSFFKIKEDVKNLLKSGCRGFFYKFCVAIDIIPGVILKKDGFRSDGLNQREGLDFLQKLGKQFMKIIKFRSCNSSM